MLDVVYILKEGENEELVYSLRSLERNFPFNRVIFVGGCPQNLEPDLHISFNQKKDKWSNARDLLEQACLDNRLTEDIVLFNDDFFVLKQVNTLPVYRNQTLEELSDLITHNGMRRNSYINTRIKPTIKALRVRKLTTYNYELHLPMKINREKMLKIIKLFPNYAKRSCYGNFYEIGGVEIDPLKMNDGSVQSVIRGFKRERTFISTTDRSWSGIVGNQIRTIFTKPSRFEKIKV